MMVEIVYEDRREAILQRLLAVATAVDSTFGPKRNETMLSDKQKYVVLLDGSEEAVGDRQGRRTANDPPPQIVEMTPEVQFRLAAKADDVGTDLNRLRIRLIAAVLTDAQLLALTVRGQSVSFAGSNTVTERGSSMEGGIGVAFTFTYLLRPAQMAV